MNKVNDIARYSVQAVVFLAGGATPAQVIYTDIDPDVVLDEDGAYYGIDLNNDLLDDFGFLKSIFSFYSESFSDYFIREDLLVGPLDSKNQIAGNTAWAYGGSSYFFTRTYPYALKHAVNIGFNLKWNNSYIQLISLKDDWGENGGIHIASCNWYNYFLPEIVDGYLGVTIISESNQKHYGWIRCDVIDSGRTLIIKDYAYQATPKTSILAGQMPDLIGGGGVVSIDNESQTFPTSIYAFGKTIYVHSKPDEYNNAVVLNMQGQLVYQQAITNKYTEIILTTVPPGMYQVILQSNQGAYSAKVMMVD